MSRSKYTPGPWTNGRISRVYSNSDLICDVAWPVFNVNQREANARLIAAAPDLLEALELSRAQWIHSVSSETCLAAIAKAKGENQ